MPVQEEESSDYSSYSEEEEEDQQEKKAAAVTSPTPNRPIARRGGQTTAAVPPAASPSSSSPSLDSEEESDDEDEDSEDEDDEPEPVKSQAATPAGSQKALQSKAASSGPAFAKPLNSKPMDGKTVKPSEPASQAKPKRLADSSKEDESRKKKKKKQEEVGEAEDLAADVEAKKEDKADGSKTPQDQKKLFQRVWDAEDEISLLTILFDYQKGGGSVNDLNGFFEFSRKDLDKFKKTQLVDKVRKLKKKYENIVAREKKSGKTTAFKTPHEMEAYSLSQLIWGDVKDTPQKEANEASGQKSPRKDSGTTAKKSKNTDGGEKQLINNKAKVSARKQEEPDSSVSKDENHVRFSEKVEIGVGRTKEDELGNTVLNMFEVVDKWIKLAEQSKVKDLHERERKLEGRMLEIHSEHLEIASARAKLALEAFKTAKAGRSRQ